MKKKFFTFIVGLALIAISGFTIYRRINYTIWTSCGIGLSFTSDEEFSDDEIYDMYLYLQSELCPPTSPVYYANIKERMQEKHELLAVVW